jgi:hypothetical protein
MTRSLHSTILSYTSNPSKASHEPFVLLSHLPRSPIRNSATFPRCQALRVAGPASPKDVIQLFLLISSLVHTDILQQPDGNRRFALRLNNNALDSIAAIPKVLPSMSLDPGLLSWLDVSFNKLSSIPEVCAPPPHLSDVTHDRALYISKCCHIGTVLCVAWMHAQVAPP